MRRCLPAALAAAVLVGTLAVPVATAATQGTSSAQERSFVVYGKPTRAQFVDHNDDRERGNFTNPFDPDLLPTPPNANSAKTGARAGDNALFSFKLYSDRKLTRLIGSAIYSCTFNFAREAVCQANFSLRGGTMIAMGPAKLYSANILLPVTGGTGSFAGAHGQFTSRPSGQANNAQIIRFRLV